MGAGLSEHLSLALVSRKKQREAGNSGEWKLTDAFLQRICDRHLSPKENTLLCSGVNLCAIVTEFSFTKLGEN